MVTYGLATSRGYSPEHLIKNYPSFEDLNYQQQLTSIIPNFDENGNFIPVTNDIMYDYKNKFGKSKDVINFRRSYLSGKTSKGVYYEIFPKDKIVLGGNIHLRINTKIFNNLIIKNIGPKQIRLYNSSTKKYNKFNIKKLLNQII